MKNELKPKYGLLTAIAMVVGIVIGSGVFFKAEKVLLATGGNLPLGILAWILGGAIMIILAYTFSIMATRYTAVGGLSDYAEATVGRPYAYAVSWFTSVIYFPAMTAVLAWVSARYTGVIFGWAPNSAQVMTISFGFLIASFALNTLSPIIAGKFQVTVTVIKLIPIALMAVVGTVVGLSNGMTIVNFTTTVTEVEGGSGSALFAALVAAAFAYEGWIIATSINAEIKNSKKNLPLALVIGTFTVAAAYVFYYIGLSGGATNAELMASGEAGARLAFERIFGSVGGVGLFVLVIISCLGTLNGLMLAITRGMYSIAIRGNGPFPEVMREVSAHTNMPTNSSIVGLLISMVWLLFFYGTNLAETPWFGSFSFDCSELPIITVYLMYIPIFAMLMAKEKGLHPVKRFVFPSLAIVCCVFMMTAAVISNGEAMLRYLIVFAVIMLLSVPFYRRCKKQH